MSELVSDKVVACTKTLLVDRSLQASYRPVEPWLLACSKGQDSLSVNRIQLIHLLIIQFLGLIPTIFIIVVVVIAVFSGRFAFTLVLVGRGSTAFGWTGTAALGF
jgi:hypothetical protein